jgi:predicted Zn-dependent protease
MRLFNILAAFVVVVSVAFFPPSQARAQTVIRDAEIERIIRTFATPIFQAAGLSPQSIDIYLIDDRSLNAFVTGGGNMFIYTGLLIEASDPLQLVGVLAHEAGHIAAGHNIGRGKELGEARWKLLAATLLGIGAGALTGRAEAAAAAQSIGQDIAVKGLLSYTRAQEAAADQAAVTYLRSTGLGLQGIIEFMNTLKDQEALVSSSQDPYLRSHPLTSERIAFIEQSLIESPEANQPPPRKWMELHQRMRAKLIGFIASAQEVAIRYPDSDTSLPARYARAISDYRQGRVDDALGSIDALLAERPNDPYFHELRGQVLLENGRVPEAIESYQRAVDLLPGESQFRLILAAAQLEMHQPSFDASAATHLKRVVAKEPNNATAWRLSSIAFGRQGDQGMTSLALAEMHFARHEFREAQGMAARAQKLLSNNPSAKLRATDLANAAKFEAELRDN